MWMIYALLSSVFAGATAILAKAGLKKVDSTLATALRTIVVLAFAWLVVLVTGVGEQIFMLESCTLLFLILSGLATGASWLCYFHALQIGPVSGVAMLDKTSTVMATLLAILLFAEPFGVLSVIGLILIFAGPMLMVEWQGGNAGEKSGRKGVQPWVVFAFLSAFFAALTAILGKIGVQNIDSNLATAIRTIVVLLAAWLMVFIKGSGREVRQIDKGSWLFLILSGCATGLSWLFYFRALQTGLVSVVVPIDKLSILFTVAFAGIFLKEKQTPRTCTGIALLTAGTLALVFAGF